MTQVDKLKGMGKLADVKSFIHADVESRMTAFLSKEDVLKHGSWGREQARLLAAEVCQAYEGENALLSDVSGTASLIRDLLQKDDLQAMSAALERFKNVDEDEVLDDGLFQFLQKHKTGVAIIADCTKCIQEGEVQLQGELFLKKLQEALNSIKSVEDQMTASAISDVVKTFWDLKSSKTVPNMVSKHKVALDVLMKDFWRLVSSGVNNMLSSTLASCLELLLDQLDRKRQGHGTSNESNANGFSDSHETEFAEVLREMKCEALLKHEFWKQAGKCLPQTLQQDLTRFEKVSITVSDLASYVFCKEDKLRAREVTSDNLKEWASCDVEVCRFLKEPALLEAFQSVFMKVAADELHSRAMAVFERVGCLVDACLSQVSGLNSMALSLADVKEKDVSMLGKGLWTPVLTCFVQAWFAANCTMAKLCRHFLFFVYNSQANHPELSNRGEL